MSRFKRFTLSLVSGYAVLAAQTAFTLASVPLALGYLSTAEFGLWALAMQVSGYIALVDFGMSGAISRILVEYKDTPQTGEYGSVVATGILVNIVQSVFVLTAGVGLAWIIARLVGIPAEAENAFRSLLIWQCVCVALGFSYRIVWHVLVAHQRQEIVNCAQVANIAINFVVLWLCFRSGLGVFSMVWGQLVGQLVIGLGAVLLGVRLKLFSGLLSWNKLSWHRFSELFSFSRDMFLYSVGAQLVSASQTILITRILGLEAGAIWSISTRTFSLISQIVYKIFDHSFPALAEMIVRKETQRLQARFRNLIVSSTSLTVAAAAMLFACNESFVALWTGGRIAWSSMNDLLLGCWLVISLLVRGNTGLIGLTRDFRFLRYVYFLEGLFFVATALVALRFGGIQGMIIASIVASLLFSSGYSVWRNAQYFKTTPRETLVGWMQPCIRLAVLLLPTAIAVWLSTRSLPAAWRFSINAAVIGSVGVILLWRYGLEGPVREELQDRLFNRSIGIAPQKS